MAKNNNKERTARDDANDLELIIVVLNNTEKKEQEALIPLSSPESPPLPLKTNKIFEPAKYANDIDHDKIYARGLHTNVLEAKIPTLRSGYVFCEKT